MPRTRLNLFLALLLCAGPAAAQTVSFKLTPPAKKPFLAEPFRLRFELTYPAGYEVRPDTSALAGGVFELLGTRRVSSKTTAAERTDVFDLDVSAFDTGVSTFPETSWLLAGGVELKEAKAPALPIEIMPVFDPKTEPEGIKDIRPPFGFTPWVLLLAGLLAAGLAAWFLYRRYAAGRPRQAGTAAPDTRSPYEKAAGALTELAASPLWREGRIKEFYIRLAGIFRGYLDGQFAIKAELLTTNDITRDLRKTGADIGTVVKTRELLEKADLVKFARLKPEETERDSDVAALKELLAGFNLREEEKRARAAAAPGEAGRR
jgi:hypothetical protein